VPAVAAAPALAPAVAATPALARAVAATPAAAAAPLSLAAAAAAAAKVTPEKLLHADMGSTDLEHYIARAKANNRDIGTITGGVGMNRAGDGTPYWGPVDNESSRAKAAEKVLTIDQWECISCGTCVEQTDKVFFLPADAKATPIAQDGPMDLIQDAIEACPVTCIHWVTRDEAAERGLATGEEPDSPRP
jgi:ferredoxin